MLWVSQKSIIFAGEMRVYYEKYENDIKGHGKSGRLFLHK